MIGFITIGYYRPMCEIFINYRNRNGLTQAELADRLGCSQAFIAHIESGRRPVPFRKCVAWSRALGVQPAELRDDFAAEVLQAPASAGVEVAGG